MFPKISIIIVNYNNWADTIECLDSLKNLDYQDFNVILIDNNSDKRDSNLRIHPNDPNIKKMYPYPLEIIFNKENSGFAGGNNIGIKKALERGSDYILLLNNDTIVEADFLKKLVEAGESDKSIGIIGPLIYKYNSDEVLFAGSKIQFLPPRASHLLEIRNPKFEIRNKPEIQNSFIETDYITGCCLLIKRKVIDKIGLMPEAYFLYYEDVEWCFLAKKQGYKSVLAPSAVIYHKQSKSTLEGSFSYIYYHTRNGLLFAKNNGTSIIKMAVFLYSFWLFLKQIAKYILMPSKHLWVRAIMAGIKDFWRNKTGKLKN